jgi:hypothetical protein
MSSKNKRPSTLKSLGEFERWLSGEIGFQERTARDTLSRLRRVSAMIDVLEPQSEDELLFRLKQSDEYPRCSPSVRSHLKRAAVLYREFLAAQPTGK